MLCLGNLEFMEFSEIFDRFVWSIVFLMSLILYCNEKKKKSLS